MSAKTSYERIYSVVRAIPAGNVATYGQIASLAGLPRQPRMVGYALSALDDPDAPWHRVINAQGTISKRADPDLERLQRRLLEHEGVEFDARGRVSFVRFRWRPDEQ
jgi:methylated-DNA-protein-cysteine methyltransferase-like protein